MADLTIHYLEQMVGSNHPTKEDTLNRLSLVEHNIDGTHGAPLSNFTAEHNMDGTHKDTVVATLTASQTLTNKTLTNPTMSGSGWPSFSVHRNAINQTLTDSVWTKVAFTTEEFDTNSNFDSATNYRFIPTVAGKYLLSGVIGFLNVSNGEYAQGAIYKNGSIYKQFTGMIANGSCNHYIPIVVVVDANGTTDYFELYAWTADNSAPTILGATISTYFTGCRIG